MEVLLIIGGIIFGFYVIQVLILSNKVTRYKNILNQVADIFEAKEYKNSEIYKKRMDYIEEVGLPTALVDLINDTRSLAIQKLRMNPYDFGNNESILLTEDKFAMRYAFVHGKAEEFKETLEMGRELQKFMKQKFN